MRIKKQYQKGFTTVDNVVLNDTNLSWKAKGLFVYLWSQADEWDFYETEVVKHSTDKIASLKSGLKELEQQGYLKRQRKRDDKGHLKENEWILSDNPMLENPMLDNPMLGNHTLTNTNNNNINNNKNESNSAKENNNKSNSNNKDNFDYKKFIEWFNELSDKNFRNTETNRKLIRARLNEGYTKEDIAKVVKLKVNQWKDNEKMNQYLRFTTLFAPTNFSNYLQEAEDKSPEPQEKRKRKVPLKEKERKDPIEEKIYQYKLFLQEHPENEDVREELRRLERNRTENSGDVA